MLAILASLLVALTVTPALSLMLLTGASERRRESPLVRVLEGDLRAILPPLARRPGWAVAVLVVAFAATGCGRPGLGEEFLPDFQENDFLMHWVEKPGTSLEAMRRITVQRQQGAARRCPACATSARTSAGPRSPTRSSARTSPSSGSASTPSADHAADAGARSRRSSTATPACTSDVLTYLKERIKEVLTGAGATVVVRIFGPDMDVLRAKAQEVDKVMEAIEGVTNLKVEPQIAGAAARRPAPPRGRGAARA